MYPFVVALMLVQLHGPTGQRIDINPAEVTSVREPQKGSGLLAASVHCVVGMGNGRFISLHEGCDEVRQKLEGRESAGPCMLVCGDTRR